MKTEIEALKSRLPKRGYSDLVVKEIPKSGRKPLVNRSVIHAFFAGRSVSLDKQEIIVKAANNAIKTYEARKQNLSKMMVAR